MIFATGYRPDHSAWLHVPGACDALGFPVHDDGAARAADGLYFVDTHFLCTRKSSLLVGVREDATLVAGRIAAARQAASSSSSSASGFPRAKKSQTSTTLPSGSST